LPNKRYQKYQFIPHYGDKKPLFTSPVIEGSGDTLFAITGEGNHLHNPQILDRLTINVFGDGVNWQYSDQLFLANYYNEAGVEPESDFDFSAIRSFQTDSLLLVTPDFRGRKKYAKCLLLILIKMVY